MAEDKKPGVPVGEQKPEAPSAPAQTEQAVIPGMEGPPAKENKVIDLSSVRPGAGQEKEGGHQEEPEKPRRGRRPKAKEAPAQGEKPKRKGRPPKSEKQAPGGGGAGRPARAPRQDKAARPPAPAKEEAPPSSSQSPLNSVPAYGENSDRSLAPPLPTGTASLGSRGDHMEPPQPRDASRAEKEEIVYLDLSQLHPFQNHPFGVRDDVEMEGLVSSVKAGGVHQPALVRPREGGSYESIAGHRRQRASELAGFRNMPCIVRNMTDDEAVLAMTDDNLRHRETILPSEKAAALQQQYEAIKHQGARGDGADVGKLSLDKVGEHNGMSGKTVQRYIYLNDLVPELKQLMDGGKLSFTPAVEVSRIRPKHQKYIAVSIEGQQSSPSKAQAKKLREMDEKNQLNPDVIDAVLSQEKKKEDFDVIISSAELAQFFGKDKTPREMKDQIMALLGEWKEKQPPELGKGEKKVDREK